MGQVHRPEDLAAKRGFRTRDIPKPPTAPEPTPPASLEAVYEEVRWLRAELERVKQALKKHGIPID